MKLQFRWTVLMELIDAISVVFTSGTLHPIPTKDLLFHFDFFYWV